MNVYHTISRANGNGKGVLEKNGHENVKLLPLGSDFDFFFKLVLTASFFGVSICLCIKWIVESYLDYIQVTNGIKVLTLTAMKDIERNERKDIDDDPTAY